MSSEKVATRRRVLIRWWIIGVVVCGAFVVAGSWVIIDRMSQAITAETLAYSVDDHGSTVVTFRVHKPVGVTATCTVQALDIAHAVVGSAQVAIPAGSSSVTLTQTVRTTNLAVTGMVADCVRS